MGTEMVGAVPQLGSRRSTARSAVTICADVRWEGAIGRVACGSQMAAVVPVAAYRRGAMPEVVEDGAAVSPGDAGRYRALQRAKFHALLARQGRVRASAQLRLRLQMMLDAYEYALGELPLERGRGGDRWFRRRRPSRHLRVAWSAGGRRFRSPPRWMRCFGRSPCEEGVAGIASYALVNCAAE